jgi:hypothetical protein
MKRSAYFYGCNSPVFDFMCLFIPCCPCSISRIHIGKPTFVLHGEMPSIIVPVWAEFGRYLQSIVKRMCFSSQVSPWGIQRHFSVCGLSTIDGCELSRTKSIEFLQWFSARHSGLLVELTESPHWFRVDGAFRGALRFGVLRSRGKLHWSIEIPKPGSKQLRHIRISWPAQPSHRRNSITAPCLSLTSIVTFGSGSSEPVTETRFVGSLSSTCEIYMSCFGMIWGECRPAQYGESHYLLDTPMCCDRNTTIYASASMCGEPVSFLHANDTIRRLPLRLNRVRLHCHARNHRD